MSTLFDSLTLGDIALKNRVLMAPLTRNRAHENGTPKAMAIEYYQQRAGAGLIITEATQISVMGKGYINTPGIYTDEHIAAWKQITDAVHNDGGKIFVQLWHVGRISHVSLMPAGEKPLAPSAIRADAQTVTEKGRVDVSEPRAMTIEEIASTVKDYSIAAKNAMKAGFDGVEIHAANGYLLDQFLQDSSNKRDDAYGGSINNRVRFLHEVVKAVIQEIGAGKTGFRLSPLGQFNDMGDRNPLALFSTVIDTLNTYNLAYLHLVEQFPGMETSEDEKEILAKLKAKWESNIIANGGFEGREDGENYIANNQADAIAYGRLYIANPDLAKRFEVGAKLNEPNPDTFYGGDEKGYTDYPTLTEQKAA